MIIFLSNNEQRRYQDVERLIIKVGSGLLFDRLDENGYVLRGDQLDALAEEVYLTSLEKEVILVSSGAIATGAYLRSIPEIPEDPNKRVELADEGQDYFFEEHSIRFRKYDKHNEQYLLTPDDVNIRHRRRKLRKMQEKHFEEDVLAIYNEKGTSFDDNDILAARFAVVMDADLLVMLSNPVEGLGNGGGKSKEEARRILARQQIAMEILNGRYERGNVSGIYKPKIRELFRD